MKIDPSTYEGRGPALVKHTFIQKYLPPLIAKIASRYDEFIYLDLFAGPWEERTADFSDTAFGIAIEAMRGAKSVWKQNGRSVKMTAHLVDRNSEAIAKQKKLIARYPDIVIHQHHGEAETVIAAIMASLPKQAFCFAFIDPKGVPDVRKFQDLIKRPNTEVFLNFMFEFANRFAGTERMPTLEWLTEEEERDKFREEINGLSGIERENALTDRARLALARLGDFRFVPAITVDEEDTDRCLYKLIFLSRHPMGIRVFRDAQRAALEIQATNRSGRKSNRRAAKSGMEDLFAKIEPIDQAERSAEAIRKGVDEGNELALELIDAAGEKGLSWGELWPTVLEEKVLTYSDLGRDIARLRKSGKIRIPDWGERIQKPRDDYQIFSA